MPQRRAIGSVYRRRRRGVTPEGTPRTGYHPGWYVRLRRRGREIRRYGGPDRKTALEVLERLLRQQDRLELLEEHPKVDLAFQDFAERYLDWSMHVHSASTHRTRRTMIRNLLVPAFRGLKLQAVRPKAIEHFIATRRAGNASGATCNRNLGVLSSIFQRAVRLGYLAENPVEKLERDREASTPLPLLGDEEQGRLVEQLPPFLQCFYVTALDTGLRLGELMRLEWSDVDLGTGRIRVRVSKNKRTRTVHATERVLQRLRVLHCERVLPISGPDVVFPGAEAKGYLNWSWRKAFKRAAARIGRPELRIHDLRHLCAINLVRRGMDLPSVQAVLGHTSLISTLRYAAYQDDTAAARAAALLNTMSRP